MSLIDEMSSPALRERKGTRREAMGEVRASAHQTSPHLSHRAMRGGPLSSPALRARTNNKEV
jgi:hypothetical protein